MDILDFEVAVLLIDLVIPPGLAHQIGVNVHKPEDLQSHQNNDDYIENKIEKIDFCVCLKIVIELVRIGH